jgi:putative methyltransferase (TIGR04325 family)
MSLLSKLAFFKKSPQALVEKKFQENTSEHLFHGVFNTFETALASAPATHPKGYDNPDSANLYLRRLYVDEYDYPSMFWVQKSLDEGLSRFADVGGSVGIKYYAFEKFISYPESFLWRVIDVPAAAQKGRDFAKTRHAGRALEFSDQIKDADGVDVFFVSGALQYLPQTLAEILKSYQKLPRRIIINTTPIHARHSYFTLNSIGTAYCAYRVQAHDEFVEDIKACGYRMRHEWQNTGKSLDLPLNPDMSVAHYSGFCFDLV